MGKKIDGVKLACRAVRMLKAYCKLCVNGVGCWKDGGEYAPHELSEKGRSNRKGFLGKKWFMFCFEDGN